MRFFLLLPEFIPEKLLGAVPFLPMTHEQDTYRMKRLYKRPETNSLTLYANCQTGVGVSGDDDDDSEKSRRMTFDFEVEERDPRRRIPFWDE